VRGIIIATVKQISVKYHGYSFWTDLKLVDVFERNFSFIQR